MIMYKTVSASSEIAHPPDNPHWAEVIRDIRHFDPLPDHEIVPAGQAPPDGYVKVGWDLNRTLPAYRVKTAGQEELVPFSPAVRRPIRSATIDQRITGFSDEAIKQHWAQNQRIEGIRAKVEAAATRFLVPNRFSYTGSLDKRGRIDPFAEVDLSEIRRPGFFGNFPWNEAVACIDQYTNIVEFEVPRETNEVLRLGKSDPIKLRGWYVEGKGVTGPNGTTHRALIVLVAGRSAETLTIHHPDDSVCRWDENSGEWMGIPYPIAGKNSEFWGGRHWRSYITAFHQAGFDVLTVDKRGHGISGGDSSSNTNEQAEDIFRALNALETGNGLRIRTPDGQQYQGTEAGGILLAGMKAKEIPTFLCGASQGSMVVMWAMHKNVKGACDFERPEPRRYGPLGYNIRGALLLAPLSGGLGSRSQLDSLAEAYLRTEHNIQFMPSSEIVSNYAKWPALFIAKGTWDFLESLEDTIETMQRIRAPKALVVVRGGHSECDWGVENLKYVQERVTSFARSILTDRSFAGFGAPNTIKEAVASAPGHWPPFSHPYDGAVEPCPRI
ncbi:MAG: hypothetical protein GY807_10080 [Gammaproteobacteria bacterium]|nr:hypothetical protein [Gammaproteobacteria bacterium]